MTRVSTTEMYDDKDVITQICKLKDGLNGALGGIISEMTVTGNDLVVEFADGTSIELALPNPTGISSITGSVSGGNLTMTIYMTDGSSHAFTCPLTGFVTLDTEQTLTAKKIFSADIEVPTLPAGDDSAVNSFYVNDSTGTVGNNLIHKDGNETREGDLTIDGHIANYLDGNPNILVYFASGANRFCHIFDFDTTTTRIYMDADIFGFKIMGRLNATYRGSTGVEGMSAIVESTENYDLNFFFLKNAVTNKTELWGNCTAVPCRFGLYLRKIISGNAMNTLLKLDLIEVVNTTTGTDPSTDTTTYPTGKEAVPNIKLAAI